MSNKGPVINGTQLISLINSVISNIFVNMDTQTISKDTLLRKFQLIKDNIDILMDRTRERCFDFNKETKRISFFIGEHLTAYLNLSISFLFISNSNESVNKEVTINMPKSIFTRFLSNKNPIIKPSYSIISSNELDTNIFFKIISYRSRDGVIYRTLEFDMADEDLSVYDDIKVVVNTLAVNFKEIDTTSLTSQIEHVKRTKIEKQVNIGYYPFIKDDGTVVKSDIVRTITSKTNDEMQAIISNNTFNPSEFTVVPIEEDSSNRVMNIQIKTREPNTEVQLSANNSQSKIYKVNWGDSESNNKIKHKYISAGTYTINVYNRLDDLKISSINNTVEILNIEIPQQYQSPLEWNNTTIENIFDENTVVVLLTKFPGRLFENGKNIEIIRSLVKSSSINNVDPLVFKGLSSLVELEVKDLFKNVLSIDQSIFSFIPRIRKMTHVFKDSKLNTLPAKLLDELEDLEDITSFAENSKITNIDENFFNENYSLKIIKSAFKNITTLRTDVSRMMSNLLEKRTLTSMESLFESSPVTFNITQDIVDKFNRLENLSSLASAFKSTNTQNNTVPFKLSRLSSLTTIESVFEGCTTFKVNSPLLDHCSNSSSLPIKVNNSLKGTTKVLLSLNSDNDVFTNTDFTGNSGLFQK